jgi:hypothetical protein
MDACCDPKVRRVVVMAASQVVGKSQMMNNMIGRFIDVDPSNMLIMHPTIAAAEKWSIGRLDPLIQETKRLHDKIQPRKSRSIGDRILHRQFRGGQMFIVGSNAPADLAAQSVRIVMADEVDRYEASAGDEGDPLELAEQRTETYQDDALVIHLSTPLIAGQSRIDKSYEESDQRIWQLWCQHCKQYFAPEDQHLRVPEREDGSKDFLAAHMICGLCGTVWSEADRIRAIDAGRFHPRRTFEGIAGFHVNALGCKRTDLVRTARRRVRWGRSSPTTTSAPSRSTVADRGPEVRAGRARDRGATRGRRSGSVMAGSLRPLPRRGAHRLGLRPSYNGRDLCHAGGTTCGG